MNSRFDYNRTTGRWDYNTGTFVPVEQRTERTVNSRNSPANVNYLADRPVLFRPISYVADPNYIAYSFSIVDNDDELNGWSGWNLFNDLPNHLPNHLPNDFSSDFVRSLINRSLYDQQLHRNPTVNVHLDRRKVTEREIGTDCTVCLQKYRENDEVSTLQCAHSFHHHCLDEWLHYKQDCPLCRTPIDQSIDQSIVQ